MRSLRGGIGESRVAWVDLPSCACSAAVRSRACSVPLRRSVRAAARSPRCVMPVRPAQARGVRASAPTLVPTQALWPYSRGLPRKLMDVYHIFDLRLACATYRAVRRRRCLPRPTAGRGTHASFRILRRKLGLGPREFGEFHVMVETRDPRAARRSVSQRLDAYRRGREELHAAVNQQVQGLTFALYRDFPDPQRETGGERF